MLRQATQNLRSAYYSTRYTRGLDPYNRGLDPYNRGLDYFRLPMATTPPPAYNYNYKNIICYDSVTLKASYFVKTNNPFESNYYIVKPRNKKRPVNEVFLL